METIHEICDLSSPEPQSSPLKIRWAPNSERSMIVSQTHVRGTNCSIVFQGVERNYVRTIFACCWNVCILHDPRISTSTSFFFGACQRKLENQRFCKADRETSRLETRANRTRHVRHGRLFRRFWFESFFLVKLGPSWAPWVKNGDGSMSESSFPSTLSSWVGIGLRNLRTWFPPRKVDFFPTFSDFMYLFNGVLGSWIAEVLNIFRW